MNDLQYRPRILEPVLSRALRAFPVVVLIGARQTGKTTLARHLGKDRRLYRTLDDLTVLDQAEHAPDTLVREDEITLDEVQRAPDLLRAVKREVDENRKNGRFLLTGSANLLLMHTVSETLAGRAVYVRLGPLTEGEKVGRPEATLWAALLAAEQADDALALLRAARPLPIDWAAAACEGGYPPVLSLPVEERSRWFDGYVTTYLERDLQQLANIAALSDFRRLMRVAALRLGGVVNQADLARDAGLSRPTAHRYLALLETSFQLRLLPAFASNRTRRLVKAPKVYWTDTGLAVHLAGHATAEDLRKDDRIGAFAENLLLCHLDCWRETMAPRPEIFYWRTAEGREVDFVIEQRRKLLPIEVKTTASPRVADAYALELFQKDHRSASFGILAHGGKETFLLSPKVIAAPLARLLT